MTSTIYYFVVGEGSLNDLSAIPSADASSVLNVLEAIRSRRPSISSFNYELRTQQDVWVALQDWTLQAPPKDSQNRIVVKLIPGVPSAELELRQELTRKESLIRTLEQKLAQTDATSAAIQQLISLTLAAPKASVALPPAFLHHLPIDPPSTSTSSSSSSTSPAPVSPSSPKRRDKEEEEPLPSHKFQKVEPLRVEYPPAFSRRSSAPIPSSSPPPTNFGPQPPRWGDNIYPPGFNPRRRFSVSDEVRKPENKLVKLTTYPKSPDLRNRILTTILKNLLFKKLDEEQLERCVDVMFERKLTAGEVIIRQGDPGDNLYVIDSGGFDVIQNGKLVTTLSPGRSFGELALMYNAPRNATVGANQDSIVWGMDRTAFRVILMDYTVRKRSLYEKFLENVPILTSLTPYERAIIADALEPYKFLDGQSIIKQGEEGDKFYIIEEGVVIVTQTRGNERPIEVVRLSKGNYFGEVALLTNKRRSASVTAIGPVKCLGLTRQDFVQLMGPCDEILKRNMENYKSYEYYLKNQGSPSADDLPMTCQSPSVTPVSKKKKKRKKKPSANKATAESSTATQQQQHR